MQKINIVLRTVHKKCHKYVTQRCSTVRIFIIKIFKKKYLEIK